MLVRILSPLRFSRFSSFRCLSSSKDDGGGGVVDGGKGQTPKTPSDNKIADPSSDSSSEYEFPEETALTELRQELREKSLDLKYDPGTNLSPYYKRMAYLTADSGKVNPGNKVREYKNTQGLVKQYFEKPFESSYVSNRPIEDPLERAWDNARPQHLRKTKYFKDFIDYEADVVIIGGGVIGCSVAYHLMDEVYKGLNVVVVEKDPSYRNCTTTLSVGGIRQQFSLHENVQMSLYGADFLRHASKLLYVDGIEQADVNFQPHGYLFLASEDGVETMQENHRVQVDCGAKVQLLTRRQLERRFPWMNFEGVAMGSYGLENEGWFDPWTLLTNLRLKAMDMGVKFVQGDVYNIVHDLDQRTENVYETADEQNRIMHNRIKEVHIHLPDGDVWPLNVAEIVIAAGAESGHIAHLCGIGAAREGPLKVPLPIEPRKRYVYNIHAPDGPGLDCPLVIDPSGTYFRREGYANHYLCGVSPTFDEEPSLDNMDVDYQWFDDKVWPILAKRADCFNKVKVKSAWSGFYDYNYFDQNAIVGHHPLHTNVNFACGFSGHGIQQAPAIGRAMAELIYHHEYKTIDLDRMGFDRVMENRELKEHGIV